MAGYNPEELEAAYQKLKVDTEAGGYHLNPDVEFTKALIEGLKVNESRYGYQSCPCRLSSGVKEEDLDIICPCDYRDPDLTEYGACYCALYVTQDVLDGQRKIKSIPERRKPLDQRKQVSPAGAVNQTLSYPVYRCSVCGYLCARDNPPEVCPICKAKKERFSRFI